MNKHHVVTTINPATAVTCSAKGKFINAYEDNLIVCKGSTVEVYTIMREGVKTFTQFNIWGVISSMQTCNIPDRSTCSLFLLTDQNHFTIVTYNPSTRSIDTEGHGLLEETNARITDQPITTILDAHSNTILVSAFTGFLFAVPLNRPDPKGKQKITSNTSCNLRVHSKYEPKAIRTNEFDFLSVVSLKGVRQQAAIAVLLGEINELKTIKTFKYYPGTNEITEETKLAVKVEATTHTLIAVPDPIGGVLAIGEYIISYHDLYGGSVKELSIDLVVVTAYTFFNDSYDQCILGDSEGNLYLLTLELNNMKVTGINSTIIGQASLPNSIVDLGNNLLYIGSSQGDPCIGRLMATDIPGKYRTDILHSFFNLGPISDFCLFDYDGQGKQTMVCCSGVDKDGSLRVVENGVGFLEQYILNLPLLSNVFCLKNELMVISTAMDTILLKKQGNDMQHVVECQQYSGFNLQEVTLATATATRHENYIVQVTSSSVRLMGSDVHSQLIAEWKPPNNQTIAIAKVNATQCIVCYGKGMLVYLHIAENALIQKCAKQFTDIACINLSPKEKNGTNQDLVLIGMWTEPSVQVLQLDTLEPILNHSLQHQSSGPKDVLMIQLENMEYLMILLGDGQLLSYRVHTVKQQQQGETQGGGELSLTHAKQNMVGTYCTAMYPFLHHGEQKIFITGIRPTIITSWHQKLFYSAVNLKNVYALTSMNDLIILMTDFGLLFGTTDSSQKLHHTKIKLNDEMPCRIQYLSLTKKLAIGTILNQKDLNNGFIKPVGKIQILDAQTFQVLDTYDLPGNELVESMTVTRFEAYPNQEYLFVGTVIENEQDPDNNVGRVLVFDLKEGNKCELIDAYQVPGVVYNIKSFQNSVIVAVNGAIYCLQRFQPELPMGNRLEFKLNIHSNVMALTLDTRNDKVLVGDLMQSVSVLDMTNRDPLSLKLLAVDNKPTWMTTVKFVSDHVYIGADDRNNVFTLTLDPSPRLSANQKSGPTHSNMSRGGVFKLDLQGGYHIGSLINCFREGILQDVLSSHHRNNVHIKQENMQLNQHDLVTATESPFTFATVHGMIGTIKTISEDTFLFFKQIQDAIIYLEQQESGSLQNIVVGDLSHAYWRNYKPKISQSQQQQSLPQGAIMEQSSNSNYLDGDLLKSFCYLTKAEKQKVVQFAQISFSVKDVEDFINTLVA